MEKPLTRKDTRAQVRAERRKAQLAREALERANVSDLTEVIFRQGQLGDVDTWLAAQIERVTEQAEKRRERHRIAIAKSLHAMRRRGETIRGIAEQTGLSERQIRDYMQRTTSDGDENSAADTTGDGETPGGEVATPPSAVDAQEQRAEVPELAEASR